jgi:alkylated DNA repair dioxygenase AlkB
MTLFSDIQSDPINLLPFDGIVLYFPKFFEAAMESEIVKELEQNVAWKQEQIRMFGKMIDMPRLTAWYGDEGKIYQYSGLMNTPLPWSEKMLQLKNAIEQRTGTKYNSALFNYYRQGSDSMGWHSDNEPELGRNPTIASVSFGASRVFQFKHRAQKTPNISITLEHNSLLLMSAETQHHWLHQIPKTKKAIESRINITFRWVI